MKHGRYVLILSAIAVFASPLTWAGQVSIVGLVPFEGLKQGSKEQKAQITEGGGLLYELGGGHMGLELGALYDPRKIATSPAQTWTYIEVPVLLRFHMGRAFSLGVGGYYAFMMGDIKRPSGGNLTAAAAGVKTSDYGVVGSAAFMIPMGKSAAFRIDGRYLAGAQSVNTAATIARKWSGYEAIVGVTFGSGK